MSKQAVVTLMATSVSDIWKKADCPPKTLRSIMKAYTNFVKERQILKKLNKRSELRKLEESLFEMLKESKFREGLAFDKQFYENQK